MKVIPDFEQELKKIDENLAVRPNLPHKVFPELEKIASVTYMGADLFSIPSGEIYDETTPNYGVDIRGEGKILPHRNRLDALMLAMQTVERLKTNKDYRDMILGTGVYSDAALKSKDEPVTELVEDIDITPQEISGKTDIKHLT